MEFILFLLSTLLDGLASEHFNDDMRFLNGTPAKLGQFPFAADISSCSASLISPKHVLTAAHCYSSIPAPDKMGRVMVGDINFKEGKPQAESRQYRNIIKIVKHPDYDSETTPNDIAVITVDKPFDMGGNIAAIPLASKPVEEGSSVIALGFGGQKRDNDSAVPTETDLAWDYFTVQGDWCKGRSKVICIEHPYRSIYFGDSGGPLITQLKKQELLGVLSGMVKSSSNPPFTALYVDVQHKRDWIREQMDGEKKSKRSVGLNVNLGPFFVYFELIVLMKDF